MTIKEIENLSGMTRANIRFYESEGLLTPARDSNGYRNYTEKDLETLKRIRLLRTLHLSLDAIRAVADGTRQLDEVLLNHLKHLEEEEAGLVQCREICEQICRDHAAYKTFDAQHYLDLLSAPQHSTPPELKEDSVPKVTAPWRRFFARDIDFMLYSLIVDAFGALVLGVNIESEASLNSQFLFVLFLSGLLSMVTQCGMTLLIEPLFLTLTGPTPGKLCFGLKVTAPGGKNLTYKEAFRRTWDVIRKGYGFFIPIYWLIRLYKSYKACKQEETLYWEEDSILHLKSENLPLGIMAWLALTPLCMILTSHLNHMAALPPNRAPLTTAQFCENFNDTQDFFGIEHQLNLPPSFSMGLGGIPDSAQYLDQTGKWTKSPGKPYSTPAEEFAPLPEFRFTQEDGSLTEVGFTYSVENRNVKISSYGESMALAAVSYICAQEDYSFQPDTPEEIFEKIKEKASFFEDFTFTSAGVTLACDFNYSGYDLTYGSYETYVLEPVYGEDAQFSVDFSMNSGTQEGFGTP